MLAATAVPASAFLADQKKVAKETEKIAAAGTKRGSYARILEELKAKVAKYSAENDVSSSLKHFESMQHEGRLCRTRNTRTIEIMECVL